MIKHGIKFYIFQFWCAIFWIDYDGNKIINSGCPIVVVAVAPHQYCDNSIGGNSGGSGKGSSSGDSSKVNFNIFNYEITISKLKTDV